MNIKRQNGQHIYKGLGSHHVSYTSMNTMPEAGIMIAAPDTKYIFYSKNNDRDKIKNSEKFYVRIMYGRNCFQHDCRYIQYDQDNEKGIDELVPFTVAYFRMKEYVHLLFGCMVHFRCWF